MAIDIVSIKCPECGAILDIEEGRQQCFCSYCGAKVILHNDNEFIYHHVDEASVKQAETDRIIKLQQLEYESQDDFLSKLLIFVWLVASVALFGIGIIGMIAGSKADESTYSLFFMTGILIASWGYMFLFKNKKKKKKRVVASDEVAISEEMASCAEKNYYSVITLFRSAGFSHVTAIALDDLNLFTQGKNGRVAEVSIDGVTRFEEGDVFPKTAVVMITYHSFKSAIQFRR